MFSRALGLGLAALLALTPLAAHATLVQIDPAANTVKTTSAASTPVGYQQITSLSAATALTVPAGATVAVIIPQDQAVRWRDDGTNPTATVGMPLGAGQPMTITGAAALAAVRFIEQAASAKLNVEYYQ